MQSKIFGTHYDLGFNGGDSLKHIAAKAADLTEETIREEIILAAREAGVTDLYLMDRDFLLSAIQEKQERMNAQPLTLEELQQMVGKPVYLVCLPFGISEWNVVGTFNSESLKYVEGKLARVIGDRYAVFINGRALAEESYGTKWIAYRHKPQEVQK